MAYIGFNPSQQAVTSFSTKLFTGDGSTTTFTLDQAVPGANEANVDVYVENVHQNPIDAYTIGGVLNNQLIFSEAPVSGASIYVIHKGESTYQLMPATGSVNADSLDPVLRNFTVDTFTGNGSTTSYTLSATALSPNAILVMVDGITQTAGVNYTVSGTTLSFGATAPDNGSAITVVHLGFASGIKSVMDRSIVPLKLSTGGPSWDTSGDFTVSGTTNTVTSGTSTSFRGNIATVTRSTAAGRAVTARLSDSVSNSTDWSMVGNTAQLSINGIQAISYTDAGRVGFGTDTPAAAVHIRGNKALLIESDTDPLYAYRHNTSANGPAFFVGKSRGPSIGGMNSVQNGDTLFALVAQGADGTNYQRAVNIFASVDSSGSISSTSMPGRLSIQTSPNGSVTPVERLGIDSNGIINIPFGQIKFPAIQNASSDVNTLDDYEEGTFTPDIKNDAGTSYPVTFASGRYTKVGKKVTVQAVIKRSSSAAPGQFALLYGLPFNVEAVSGSYSTHMGVWASGAGGDGLLRGSAGHLGMTGNGFIYFVETVSSTSGTAWNPTSSTAGDVICIQSSYITT